MYQRSSAAPQPTGLVVTVVARHGADPSVEREPVQGTPARRRRHGRRTLAGDRQRRRGLRAPARPGDLRPLGPRVLDLATPAVGERVLDTACGTGVVARLAADRVGPTSQVVGLDLNPGMLAVASTLPPVRPRSPGSSRTTCPSPTAASRSSPASSASSTSPTAPPPCPRWPGSWPRRPPGGHGVALDRPQPRLRRPGRRPRPPHQPGRRRGRAPFALNDEDALHDLLARSGFGDVAVHRQAGTIRFNSSRNSCSPRAPGRPWPPPSPPPTPPTARASWPPPNPPWPWQTPNRLAFPIEALLLSGRVP